MVVGEVARPVDVIVIGGGPGGYTAAARAAALGQEVVLVEDRHLGGVCVNVGCIPSKALISVAHDFERVEALAASGIKASATLEFPRVQEWKQEVVDKMAQGVRQVLSGVEVVEGFARFLDPHRVAVESGDQVAHFRFEHAVIASGSRPAELDSVPFDGERIVDSTGALAFSEPPGSLAVVGGGYVGMELGMAYAKLGSRVTIIEALDRVLTGFDTDLIREIERSLDRLGIELRTQTLASGVDDEGLAITSGETTEHIPADRILVAVGRRPNTDDLQLEEAGIEPAEHGLIDVDEQRRTSAPHIFAIGDVTPGPALAHKAIAEGRVAAEVIAGLPSGFDQVVPLIAFTDPELASVGLSEDDAKEQGYDVVVGRAKFGASGRAATLGDQRGLVKIVADAEEGTILGVHLVGPSASDLVSEAALAVEMAARTEDVATTIHPHPTLGEIVGAAALDALHRASPKVSQ